MDSQKIENELNLALDSTLEEREKSGNLNVGFDEADKTWELIVRYTGSLERFRILGISVVELLNGYAILTVPQNMVDMVAASNEIIYVEKPKGLNFAIDEGKRVSCINQVQEAPFNLDGSGCIICTIDSGIDYENEAFLNQNGTTRILELWDQTVVKEGNPPPQGYAVGALFTLEDINKALSMPVADRHEIVPSTDRSGHGTAVASISAAVATGAELIIVKMGNPGSDSLPKTSELMQAIDFCVRRGLYYGRPIAINISFGNNYGSHDGTSLLATYIDSVSDTGRNVIVVGTGNEGASGNHAEGMLIMGEQSVTLLAVGRYETSLNVQLWKTYGDSFRMEIIAPSGKSSGVLEEVLGAHRYTLDNTVLLIYYGEPSPYSRYQEIYVELIPRDNGYIDSGIWRIILTPLRIIDGRYDMWLPVEHVSSSTGFLTPTPNTTLTVPSTADSVISVGAYDPLNFSYADFSGRGYTRVTNQVKPDIAAPGVNIECAAVGGGTVLRTGTSFATPFVTGGAALMMEWGIVRGNDMYLYGEKVKAYMISGARRPESINTWPNPQLGWGLLCVRDSLPL